MPADRFTEAGEGFVDLLEANWKLLVGLVVVIIMTVSGAVAFKRASETRQADLQGQVAAIASIYPGDPDATVPPGAEAAAVAAEKYQAFLNEGAEGPALYMAQINLGRTLEATGDTDKAGASYREALSAPAPFAAVAHMRLGYLAANAGQHTDAAEHFKQAASADRSLAAQASLEMAYMAEISGDTGLAITRYVEVAKAHPESPQEAEARSRIRVLGGDPAELLGENVPEPVAMPTGNTEAPAEPATDAAAPADTSGESR